MMDVGDESSRQYKQLLRKEDQAWDLLLACMKLPMEGNAREYERRFAEGMQAKGQLKKTMEVAVVTNLFRS